MRGKLTARCKARCKAWIRDGERLHSVQRGSTSSTDGLNARKSSPTVVVALSLGRPLGEVAYDLAK